MLIWYLVYTFLSRPYIQDKFKLQHCNQFPWLGVVMISIQQFGKAVNLKRNTSSTSLPQTSSYRTYPKTDTVHPLINSPELGLQATPHLDSRTSSPWDKDVPVLSMKIHQVPRPSPSIFGTSPPTSHHPISSLQLTTIYFRWPLNGHSQQYLELTDVHRSPPHSLQAKYRTLDTERRNSLYVSI